MRSTKNKKSLILEEQLTNTIIDYLPAQIFWKDKDLYYLGCNMAFVKSLGLTSKEEIIGKSDFDLPVSEENSVTFRADDRTVIQSKQPKLNIEESQILIDGTERILSTSKVPLLDETGEAYGVLGIYIDITDRIKMERSLAKAKEQAEISNRAKTEFIANMSHDIRTPVGGIIGISKLMEERLEHPEDKQYAHWINESGQQLLSLLNSVLDIVSTTNNIDNHLIEEEFDLYQTLTSLINLELPTVKLKGLELKLDFDKAITKTVITDRTKLVRILLNLIGNAIKFTEKGTITIHVKKIKEEVDFEEIEFTIADSGIGIPPELQQKVFDRFYRINPSYKGKYEGHGVGLHIVQNYLNILNSSIALESEVDVGTKVTFNIKVKHGQQPVMFNVTSRDEEVTPAYFGEGYQTPTILVVEDNPIALRIVESLLKQAGCRYRSAANGEEALSLLEKNTFDLILTDIGLPGISGQELAEIIRREKNNSIASLPIIGLTAHAAEKIEKSCLHAGMNKVLSKPISAKVLQETLVTFLAHQKPPNKESNGLGADLPKTEQELFQLDDFPLLDIQSALTNLGTEEIVKELLNLMVHTDLPQEESQLTTAYQVQNWPEIEKIAHKLKSGALYCGTIKLQYACQYLERYLKAGHSHYQEELYQQLQVVLLQTKVAINEWLFTGIKS
ncbi:PAS domain-containing hybrid sensor histidine kinase/response regulator [Legionella jamestowniensis]|uniref:histidine kinase n=1 Tax=Legionella jamestowniensis TaxID=455 RepID=A0A0W0UGQ3_9GAMM|nr:PAS domain-containing sensor histidine kinase [Legionella jamestowniensis]KTD07032.1 sensory box histidine kinase/response regulator [Legionella jamestowniensis]SFM03492.1 PAS domain S-box-containing protein [Legionella jamestowniensis DSM 19215]